MYLICLITYCKTHCVLMHYRKLLYYFISTCCNHDKCMTLQDGSIFTELDYFVPFSIRSQQHQTAHTNSSNPRQILIFSNSNSLQLIKQAFCFSFFIQPSVSNLFSKFSCHPFWALLHISFNYLTYLHATWALTF